MSRSNNRHPVETYELRDMRRLWHVPGPVQPPFGCTGCHHRNLCGGLQVDTPIFNCITFCRCADPATCDNVCPKNMRHFVARSQEVGGFELTGVPRAPELPAPALPPLVPLIYHGDSRNLPLRIDAVALPLAEMIARPDGALRFQTRAELLRHFQLHADCQLILSGTDKDPTIERWWRTADREAVIRGLRTLGVVAITSPNYSLFLDVPRHDNLYNLKRIALAWSEIQREGLPAALHVNARTNRDWERWAEFIIARPEITMLAFEFGTGAGAKGRIAWHVEQLILLARRAQRPLTLIVRGGSMVLPQLAAAYPTLIYIDTASFLKTMNRQRAHLSDGVPPKLEWASAPTVKGAPLDELLLANVSVSTAWARQQLPGIVVSARAKSVKPPLLTQRADDIDDESLQASLLGEPCLWQCRPAAVDGKGMVVTAEPEFAVEVGQANEQCIEAEAAAGVHIEKA